VRARATRTSSVARQPAHHAEDVPGSWRGPNKRPDLSLVGLNFPCARASSTNSKLTRFAPLAQPLRRSDRREQIFAGRDGSRRRPHARAATFTDARKSGCIRAVHGAPLVIKAEGLAEARAFRFARQFRAAESGDSRVAAGSRPFGAAGEPDFWSRNSSDWRGGFESWLRGWRACGHDGFAQDQQAGLRQRPGPQTPRMCVFACAGGRATSGHSIQKEVFQRTLAEVEAAGIVYKGVLYAG